jgi:glycerol-3-phosphate dehydrogenase
MIPQTDDGRVLFAIPWHDRVIVGTTETALEEVSVEPVAFENEIDFLLTHAARYLTKDPQQKDILSIFAGIRPLVSQTNVRNTAELSRDHTCHISPSGLLTVTGGKWTTYRKMAEDAIDQAILIADLAPQPSATENLNIHGYHKNTKAFADLAVYGSDAVKIMDLMDEKEIYKQTIHPRVKTRIGEIIWSVRREWARTVEDFLARRTRHLLLDARTSMEMAPIVADWIGKELEKSRSWKKQQVSLFRSLANKYLP